MSCPEKDDHDSDSSLEIYSVKKMNKYLKSQPHKAKTQFLYDDYENLKTDELSPNKAQSSTTHKASSKCSDGKSSKHSKRYAEDLLTKKEIYGKFAYDCFHANLSRKLSADMELDSNMRDHKNSIQMKNNSKTTAIPMKVNKQKISDNFNLIESSDDDKANEIQKIIKKAQEDRRPSILSKLEDNMVKKFTED